MLFRQKKYNLLIINLIIIKESYISKSSLKYERNVVFILYQEKKKIVYVEIIYFFYIGKAEYIEKTV